MGQHGQAERERLRARVQGSVAQVLVPGVRPGARGVGLAGIRAGTRSCGFRAQCRQCRQGRVVLLCVFGGGRVSRFWIAALATGPAPVRSSGRARAHRTRARSGR
jgi:hypothetical protein